MDVYDHNRAVLYKAAKEYGGWEAIAKSLREKGFSNIKRQTVLTWTVNVKAGVPNEYLVAIEEITGVPREELRKDIPWR